MTKLVILSGNERVRFDEPPRFTAEERSAYFSLNNEDLNLVEELRNPTTKAGFVLQFGYFKSNAKFYTSEQFRRSDMEFIAKMLCLDPEKIDFSSYQNKTPIDHRKKILSLLKWQSFDESQHKKIEGYVVWLVQRQLSLKQIFLSIIDFCWQNKIELPSYYTMSVIITDAYNRFESGLIKILVKQLKKPQIKKLNDLAGARKETEKSRMSRPQITLIKNINQGLRPMDIQDNIDAFNIFKEYFNEFKEVIDALKLSDQATEYFATWVQKAKTSQLNSFSDKNKLYLYLLCYIKHQFYYRHDVLVGIFLKSTQSAVNFAKNKLRDFEKENRSERNKAIKKLSSKSKESRELIEKITEAVNSPIMSASGKLATIEVLINDYHNHNTLLEKENILLLEKALDRISSNQTYFDALESISIKLQNKVSSLTKHLTFNPSTSSPDLITAINYFSSVDGNLDQKAPTDFLTQGEKDALYKQKKLRVSLYKVLLFSHMADAIKSGHLNVLHSYKYRAIHEYLIDEQIWDSQRKDLLERAGLTHFCDFQATMDKFKVQLDNKYKSVNERFLSGKNIHLKIDKNGKVIIQTPKTDSDEKEYIASLLSKAGYVPILQILSDINHIAHYTDSFRHFSVKHKKMLPKPKTLFAGLIAKGCNIGIERIAHISIGISEDILKNTVNWCFSLKNIQRANNKVTGIINKLFLSNAYRHTPEELHTGSDGRKVNVSVDSLHANYSYKYFGKGKGVSIYTFLDERQLLFYSTVISASEREAAYVIDGLQQNEVVQSTIHSTDTHGFTETVFAVSPFINTAFAPRIKDIGSQNIYSFSTKQTYEKRGYKILPSRLINLKLIEKYWDDILRFMATIKLKHTTASQLFKRLSSYAKDHPLYQALKEFGRIIKSIFILTYFDDVELRQRIEKQLNKVELSNRFSKAVFFSNNGEFRCGDPEEQKIIAACKAFIQNAIVLWNYLYLSQLLANNADPEEQKCMLESIKRGSITTWRHINLHGEYNFTKYAANQAIFDMERILGLKIA